MKARSRKYLATLLKFSLVTSILLFYQNCSGNFESIPTGSSDQLSQAPPKPALLNSLENQEVFATQSVSFVIESAEADLSYSWFKFNQTSDSFQPITGINTSTLQIGNATVDDAGTYKVVVENSQGGQSDSSASLVVKPPPAITTELQNQSLGVGGSANFSIGATGESLQYDWTFDNQPVGGNSSNLTLSDLQLSDSGKVVQVVVSNPAGSVPSTATVTVNANPPDLNTANLTWDPNSEPDLAGYKVYYGTASGVYSDSLDAGMVQAVDGAVRFSVANLPSNNTYYFAVSAYDNSGNESLKSSEANISYP